MKPELYQLKALAKLANSDLIKRIYPMVERIQVFFYERFSPIKTINIIIRLNDDEITSDNMYEKGFDPHYLVDHHLAKLMGYVGLSSRTNPVEFVVYGPKNNIISRSGF